MISFLGKKKNLDDSDGVGSLLGGGARDRKAETLISIMAGRRCMWAGARGPGVKMYIVQ